MTRSLFCEYNMVKWWVAGVSFNSQSKDQNGKSSSFAGWDGGVGKTRLALELAERIRDKSKRLIFCDMSQVDNRMGILHALASSMNIRLQNDSEDMLVQVLLKNIRYSSLVTWNKFHSHDNGDTKSSQQSRRHNLLSQVENISISAESVVLLQPLFWKHWIVPKKRPEGFINFDINEENRTTISDIVQQP